MDQYGRPHRDVSEPPVGREAVIMKELLQSGILLLVLYALVWGVLGWFFLAPALEILYGVAHVLEGTAVWLQS